MPSAYDLVVSDFRRSPAALIDWEDIRARHHLTNAEIEGVARRKRNRNRMMTIRLLISCSDDQREGTRGDLACSRDDYRW